MPLRTNSPSAFVCLVWLLALVPARAVGPTPCGDPATGDCCAATGSPGCADSACCAAVCACDSFCCEVEWDDFCAGPNGNVPGCSALTMCESCAPPAPEGACCLGLDCAPDTASECAARGGIYLGEHTVCGASGGEPPRVYGGVAAVAIPDGDPLVGVAHTITVFDNFVIGDVNVAVTISHHRVGDLVVALSHGGTTVTLINQPGDPTDTPGLPAGCTNGNYDVVLDDEGDGGTIESRCAPDLTSPPDYRPNNPLHAFDGLDAAGSWTLTVWDTAALFPGTLESWSIAIAGPSNPCIPTGACCTESQPCAESAEPTCHAAGGFYLGDDSSRDLASTLVVESAELSEFIPDADPESGVSHSLSIAESFPIRDVDAGVRLTHQWVGDLVIELEHGGTRVTLLNQPGDPDDTPEAPFGCANDNYDVVLDDEGMGGPIEDQCVNDLTSPPAYRPNNPLYAFDGMDTSGTWTITVRDTAVFSVGRLTGWSLHLTGPAVPDTCAGQFRGACCDTRIGQCMDDSRESECSGAGLQWFRGSDCTAITCRADLGACCNRADGTCVDQVSAPDCATEVLNWHDGAACVEIDCAPPVGACCRPANGDCIDAQLASECTGPGTVWLEGKTCAQADCQSSGIPATSHWGLIVLALALVMLHHILGRASSTRSRTNGRRVQR